MTVADLSYPVRLVFTNSVAPFGGLQVQASDDPLTGRSAFVTYVVDGVRRYGYVWTRLAADVRGTPWGMGLLYEVDAGAPSSPPRPNRAPGRHFRRLAEIEFGYA
ncbi:hypothetical protein [Microbacterium sp.]|uniref:hypothetical protein n=1 Tax=Microbacterium sp. TaxID=51671 RepID=UPI0039E5F344